MSSRCESNSLQTREVFLPFELDPVSHVSDSSQCEPAVAIDEDLGVSLELFIVLFLSTLLGMMLFHHLHALEFEVDLLLTIHLFF